MTVKCDAVRRSSARGHDRYRAGRGAGGYPASTRVSLQDVYSDTSTPENETFEEPLD